MRQGTSIDMNPGPSKAPLPYVFLILTIESQIQGLALKLSSCIVV